MFVVAGVLGVAGAFQQPEPDSLRFEQQTQDLGVLQSHEKYIAKFYAFNESRAELTDMLIVPSCGCTTVAEVENPIRGRTRVPIEVQLNTGHLKGKVHKPISVYWKCEGQQKSTTIFLTGYVEPRFSHEPQVVEFNHNSAGVAYAKVKSSVNGERAPQVKSASANTNAIKCTIADQQEALIEVRYDPAEIPKINRTSAAVTVILNDLNESRFVLPVRFTVPPTSQ
ncbi:MAG: DUF1573 domain-containing protein [Planctomycetota bacterium]